MRRMGEQQSSIWRYDFLLQPHGISQAASELDPPKLERASLVRAPADQLCFSIPAPGHCLEIVA